MTVNDQHIAICQSLQTRTIMLVTALDSMLQILQEHPPAKRDKLARQTTMMMNEVVRLVSGAEVTANLLERSLRYSRIAGQLEDED
jgi:hypothetical protein